MSKFKKTAGIILKHRDQVLMCKRSPEKTLPNTWSIPSGHIENDESPGNAAVREFYEETNIKVGKNIDFVGFLNRFNDDGTKRGHMFVFVKEIDEKIEPDLKNAKDGFEHTECRYFKNSNIPKEDNNEELIDLIKKVLK
jgi:8-oxo-dGTP pyrophosphatase MutT (NUDIX family)